MKGLPSGEGFTIRPATPDDIHAVAHVLDDAYHHFNMSKGYVIYNDDMAHAPCDRSEEGTGRGSTTTITYRLNPSY